MQSENWYPGTTSIAEKSTHLQGLSERKHDSGYLTTQSTGMKPLELAAVGESFARTVLQNRMRWFCSFLS